MIAWLKRVLAENSLAQARVEEEAERQRSWTAAGFKGRCPAPFPPGRPAGVTNPPPPPPTQPRLSWDEAVIQAVIAPDKELIQALRVAFIKNSSHGVDLALAAFRRRMSGMGTTYPMPPRSAVGGYQPITFDESAGVTPPASAGPLLKNDWASSRFSAARAQIVLGLPFFLHVHNILDEAECHMRAGDAVDLDEIALLLSSRLRENLAVVYERAAEGR